METARPVLLCAKQALISASLRYFSCFIARAVSTYFHRGLLIAVLLSGLGWAFAGTAAPASSYCYESFCYPTLAEAEAKMRSVYAYGQSLVRSGSGINSYYSSAYVSFTYVAPNQPPVKFNPPSYSIGGWGYEAIPGFCARSADPNFPGRCADEAEISQNMMAYYRQVFPDCSFTNIRVEGSYGEPFVLSATYAGAGFLGFQTPQDKWLKYDIWCPGWGQSNSEPRELQLIKQQTYDCPAGYWPITGYNPAYNTTGNPDYIAIWPYLCTAGATQARITKFDPAGPRQRPSCAANANPCFPATGDKMRTEPDFDFAGRRFTRYYHSLQEVQHTDAMAPGWSHSFLERIAQHGETNRVFLFGEDGYIQSFSSIGYRTYRGDQNVGELVKWLNDGSWLLIKSDGERRTYSPMGLLKEIFSPISPALDVVLSYSRGKLSLVVDGTGRSLRFTYEGGLLSQVTADDGASAVYRYDADRNLTSVTYADGASRSYRYNEAGNAPSGIKHLLTGIFDGGARYATFKYDFEGRADGSTLHGQSGPVEQTTIIHDGSGEATVTGPLGLASIYLFSDGAFPQVTGINNAVGTRMMQFDSRGRPSSGADARGTTWRREFTQTSDYGLVDSATEAENDSQWRTVIVIRDGNNRISEWKTSSPAGIVSLNRRAYNSLGLPQSECQYDVSIAGAAAYLCGTQSSAPVGVRQVVYSYCESNSSPGCPMVGLLSGVDSSSWKANYTYFDADEAMCSAPGNACAYRKGDLRTVTNGLGHVKEVLAYDGAGRAGSVKDSNGTVTDYEYNARGWLISIKVRGADGGSEADDHITRMEYSATGLVSKVSRPNGEVTNYIYDTAHRLTDILDGDGNRIHFTLDGAGNRVQEEIFGAGEALKRSLSRVYDVLGRLTTEKGADGYGPIYSYDPNGNVTSTIDAQGISSTATYDTLNRLTQTLQDVGGIAASTQFKYDALDNLTEVTDPKGLKTTYTYDGLGQLKSIASPDTGTTQRAYDAAGNLKTSTDARGITATYSYDALSRVTAVRYPGQGEDVTYTYDTPPASCAASEGFGIGRLSSLLDGSGRTDYCYNRFGSVVRKVQVTNGKTFVVRYTYTTGGNLAAVIYPSGAVVDYVRDTQGRITEVGVTSGISGRQVLLTGVTYLPFGPSTGWLYGNGRALARNFDTDYRPTAVVDSGNQLKIGLGYDTMNNITALESGTYTADLDYDALGRLIEFRDATAGVAIEQYTYDATGNRLSFSNAGGTVPYTYEVASHRLTSIGGSTRTYDAVGNTITAANGAKELVYNQGGRLSQVRLGGVIAQNYAYNARGERVQRGLDATSRVYTVYDESGYWLGDYDALGNAAQQVIWMDDTPVGVLAGGALHYIEADHLGTPRLVYDPARNVPIWTWNLKGEAFGADVPDQDPDADGHAFVFDMRFPGQRYDVVSGLHYNYYRDYDSGTGRYVQSDPIGLGAGPNTYAYSMSAPTVAFDLKGLAAVRLPPYEVGQKLPYGTIYCDEGVVKPFVNWGRLASYERECLGDCIVAHEQSHAKDASRSNPGVCRYWGWVPFIYPKGVVGFDNRQELLASEFRAYAVELRCLMAKLAAGNCTSDMCVKVVRGRIDDVVNKILPTVSNGTY